jgi:MFS family permease
VRVLVAVTLTQLLVVIDFFALNLTLPSMARDFGVAPTDLQFVISGYMIALGAFMIPAGRLSDLVGRRRVTVIGVAVFGVASAVCGAAPNETIVVLFRLVGGIGAAMCFRVSISMITATFPAEPVQRTLGTVYGFAAIGTAIGPLGGGLLSQASWRWVGGRPRHWRCSLPA